MKKTIKYWFSYSQDYGRFFPEYTSVDCEEHTRITDIEWPEHAYSAIKKSQEIIDDNGSIFKGGVKEVDGITYYHPDCKILNTEQVKEQVPDNEILLDNMRINEWDEVLQTPRGRIYNLPKKYEVVKHDTV
jgi:hypothetical protein